MMVDDVRQYRAIAVTIVTGEQKKSRLASGKDRLRTVHMDPAWAIKLRVNTRNIREYC